MNEKICKNKKKIASSKLWPTNSKITERYWLIQIRKKKVATKIKAEEKQTITNKSCALIDFLHFWFKWRNKRKRNKHPLKTTNINHLIYILPTVNKNLRLHNIEQPRYIFSYFIFQQSVLYEKIYRVVYYKVQLLSLVSCSSIILLSFFFFLIETISLHDGIFQSIYLHHKISQQYFSAKSSTFSNFRFPLCSCYFFSLPTSIALWCFAPKLNE